MFLGKTYILISNSTFSAGSALADIFKYNKLATLVGEPTGNATSFYANPTTIDLPNSKIKCSISTKYILGANKNSKSNTVTPDIQVTSNIRDIISNIDPIVKSITSE